MTIPEIFREYIWIVTAIYEAKEISLKDLEEKWRKSDLNYGSELSRTTFKRYKNAIADVFGIDIECSSGAGYKYRIANRGILESDTVQNWIISTLSVNNLMTENIAMQDRIVLEEAPSGGRMLAAIVKAMRESVAVKVVYRRFGCEGSSDYEIEPYALKLFGRRWYVVARSPKHDVAVFALDRMHDLELTDRKYEMDENFDVREHFKDCFGVIAGDGTPVQTVVLRAFGTERDYIDSLPLHRSQKCIVRGDGYSDYQYELKTTYDFKQTILSRAQNVEVLKPKALREEIKQMLSDALGRYK